MDKIMSGRGFKADVLRKLNKLQQNIEKLFSYTTETFKRKMETI